MILHDYKQIDNCSTIIVGKNASATGKVLMAHNEDDMNCLVQTHVVPRKTHPDGETIIYKDGPAVIPQVKETCKYTWSEFRSPNGESFADGFANEYGVVVVSNGCIGTNQDENDPQPKGIGYALRQIIAERATSARHGVEIAAEMVKTYGYISTRSYTIVDKDEGWFFQVTTGTNYVAKRIGDDEIAYIPNWLTIHSVDFTDTEHKNYYWSDTLVSYPMSHGWYKPAVPGDYSDFDFARAYQAPGEMVKSNMDRSDLAWSQLVGEKLPYKTTCVKAPKIYTIDDLKKVMRSHYMEWEEDLKTDPTMSPHRYGICRDTTVESLVVEFSDKPETSVVWRASPRPCVTPYTPWFIGIERNPTGYEWNTTEASRKTHLSPDADEFKYNKDFAYWAFRTLQNTMEFNYPAVADKVHADIAKLEAEWKVTVPEIIKTYDTLDKVNHEYAVRLLTDFTCAQAQKVWDWALCENSEITDLIDKQRMDFWRSKL